MALSFENKFQENLDEIRIKGVRCLGYGRLSKFPMLDPALTIEAKAIYAYFCSFTASGNNKSFPSRDTIVRDLHINKDTYYKHYHLILEQGYITAEQVSNKNKFNHNVYTIEEYSNKFDSPAPDSFSEAMKTSFRMIQKTKEISSAGYGIIPKYIMQSSLPIQAKGIYAFLSVFASQDYESTPDRDTMLYYLGIGLKTFQKHMNSLLTAGFVTREQCVTNGHFGRTVYRLVQNPDELNIKEEVPSQQVNISDTQFSDSNVQKCCDSSPVGKISDSIKQDIPSEVNFSDADIPDFLPIGNISDSLLSDSQFSDTQITDINNTSSKKTNLNNYNNYFNSQSINLSLEKRIDSFERSIDNIQNFVSCDDVVSEILQNRTLPFSFTSDPWKLKNAIHYLTEWDTRHEVGFYTGKNAQLQQKIYKLFVEALIEMLTADGPFTFVKGQKISFSTIYELVVENFFVYGDSLNGSEYACLDGLPDLVCDIFQNAGFSREIRNPKAYMKTIIYTVLQSSGINFPAI